MGSKILNRVYLILLFYALEKQCTGRRLKYSGKVRPWLSNTEPSIRGYTPISGHQTIYDRDLLQSLTQGSREALLLDILRRVEKEGQMRESHLQKEYHMNISYQGNDGYSGKDLPLLSNVRTTEAEKGNPGDEGGNDHGFPKHLQRESIFNNETMERSRDNSRIQYNSLQPDSRVERQDGTVLSKRYHHKTKNTLKTKSQNPFRPQGNSALPPSANRQYMGGNYLTRPRFYKHRFFFGPDDRGRVSPYRMRKYPYKNIVRLSNGCTGTLISPKHVLTAAHCLHGGDQFKGNPSSLRIEVPHSMGIRIYYGKAFKVTRKWHKLNTLSNVYRAMFDYGVVELRTQVPDHRKFMKFDWTTDTWKKMIRFIAYPYDQYPFMLESTCLVDFKKDTLLLNRCDSASGSSGSAATMIVGKYEQRIVGVVSAVISDRFPNRHYNAITRLTLSKVWDICDMIGPSYNHYVCSDRALQNRPRYYRKILVHGR